MKAKSKRIQRYKPGKDRLIIPKPRFKRPSQKVYPVEEERGLVGELMWKAVPNASMVGGSKSKIL